MSGHDLIPASVARELDTLDMLEREIEQRMAVVRGLRKSISTHVPSEDMPPLPPWAVDGATACSCPTPARGAPLADVASPLVGGQVFTPPNSGIGSSGEDKGRGDGIPPKMVSTLMVLIAPLVEVTACNIC